MARRRKPALVVPATPTEAQQLLDLYVAGERAMLALRLSAEVAIDRIKTDRDQAVAAIAGENDVRFQALKAWWEAGGHEAAGERRSVTIGGAEIGLRLSPPAVKLRKGLKAAAVIAWLKGLRWSRSKDFLRTKVELDKPAIIKAVRAEDEVRKRFEHGGLTVVQVDEFFIDCGLDEDAMRSEITAP